MGDEESRSIRAEVIRALAGEGEDVSEFADAAEVLEAAGAVELPTWEGVPAALKAREGGAPGAPGEAPGDEAASPEERAAVEAQVERDALEAVLADVRAQSAAGRLSRPAQWAEAGLAPAHLTGEQWEMFVYEYLEDRAAARDAVAPAAAEAAPVEKPRSATCAVGVPRAFRPAAEPAGENIPAAQDTQDEPVAQDETPEQVASAEPAAQGEQAAPAETTSQTEPPAPPDAPAPQDAAPAPDAPACDDIAVLMGAYSYYLYSRDHMTDAFARWAFLACEDDRVATLVECVRQESRTYPRPMEAAAFSNEPFGYSADEVAVLWEAVRASGAYPDLAATTASNGDVYYYSTDYLTPAYADSLAEWNSVERSQYL